MVASIRIHSVEALTMMQRFGTDVENALEAHDRHFGLDDGEKETTGILSYGNTNDMEIMEIQI